MGRYGSTSGTYLSIRAKARAVYNYAKRFSRDPKGVTRHQAGAINDTLFGYLPATPTPGLVCCSTQIWNFQTPGEVVTDQVDPIMYMWQEQSHGTGIPLRLIDGIGGAADVTLTSKPAFLFYQAGTATINFERSFWFRVEFLFEPVLPAEFIIGLMQHWVDPGDFPPDNVPNAAVFYNCPMRDNLYYIVRRDDPTTLGYQVGFVKLKSDVTTSLGMKFIAEEPGSKLMFYENNELVHILRPETLGTDWPRGNLKVSFGIANEVEDQARLTLLSLLTIVASPPQVCEQ